MAQPTTIGPSSTRLADAKRELNAGNWKPSIAASREACELLRKMRPATVNPRPQQRELPERETVILAKLGEFTQALFDHDSAASHPDEHLRDIAWNRENAVLALGDGSEPGSSRILRPLVTSWTEPST